MERFRRVQRTNNVGELEIVWPDFVTDLLKSGSHFHCKLTPLGQKGLVYM
jgi:hypothetical protein